MITKPNKNHETPMMKKIMNAMIFSFIILLIPACNKEDDKSNLSVRMTDVPGNYTAVMIDLQSVEVTGDGGSAVMLNTNAGIYNLLDLANGVNTLIATGDLEAGTVSQIRLILGPNNTVSVGGIVYPLQTPSASQSGLKLQIHEVFEPGVSYSILLDFDANQSIVSHGNGEYSLKPVIRVINASISGSIMGSITPIDVIATVAAVFDGTTYTSINNTNGEFLIAGLPAGTYDLIITPPPPLEPVAIAGVTVTTGVSTDVGIITL